MEQLSDFVGFQAEWIQPKALERTYELRCGEAVLASLSFRSSFGTLALAETAEGQWTFKRVGFLNPRVTVRVADEEDDLAVYRPKFWGDGVLTFDDGASYAWAPTNFWHTVWAFSDSAGQLLLSLTQGREKGRLSDIFKTQASVEIAAPDAAPDVLAVLLTLGMYLLILHQQDAAAAVAATGAAAAT